VGTDLGKAIFAGQNNTIRFAEVGDLGVTVQRGPTLDGLGQYYREAVDESPEAPVDVAKALVDAGESLDRVAALAGHANLNTTARYTKPTRADLERAVERLEWT
jgi:myo-inositol-1-phosphate synthase